MGRWSFSGVLLIVLLILLCPYHGSAEERYTVKSGDSLYTISRSFGISVEALKEANGLEGNQIRPKQVLFIPNPQKRSVEETAQRVSFETEAYIVKQGDSLYSISKRVGLSVEEIKRMNDLQTNDLKKGQKLILPKQKSNREEEPEEIGDAVEVQEIQQVEGAGQITPEPLGKWKNPDEKGLFIRVVKNFLGVPYRLGGSTLKGIDCSAFVKKIFDIFNIQLPRTAREQSRLGKKVDREELQEGDLVFFKTRWANNSHVGIYIGNNEFIHASYRGKEVRVDSLDTPYFNQRFVKGVRVIELERES
ncbi:MAG: LysM peptidoglycan-binding domain-containing protein [Thermodesulfobacteriota bacterium]|nr:LysM peptidoglycan-binding domain-containing protein [Thermodesulfobacteriota bacterium]